MNFVLYFQEDLTKETLLKQFKIVKSRTNTSHVQQFGNKVRLKKDRSLIVNNAGFVLLLSAVGECLSSGQKLVSGGETCLFPAGVSLLILHLLPGQTLAHMKLVQFQGNHKADSPPAAPVTLQPITNLDLTPSPDVPLAILKRKLMASNDIRLARGLLMEISTHLKVK